MRPRSQVRRLLCKFTFVGRETNMSHQFQILVIFCERAAKALLSRLGTTEFVHVLLFVGAVCEISPRHNEGAAATSHCVPVVAFLGIWCVLISATRLTAQTASPGKAQHRIALALPYLQ